MRLFSKMLQNPDVLLDPPDEVIPDDGITPLKVEKAVKEQV